MLSDVVSIIGREEGVCVTENTDFRQLADHSIDDLIHSLEGPETASVEMVVGVDIGLILFLEIKDPRNPTRLRS